MEVNKIEKYDVEAWLEDLVGLYYGYGKGDDMVPDVSSAMVRNFCVNRMSEQIYAMNKQMRKRRNMLIASSAVVIVMFLCWLTMLLYCIAGRVM